MLEGVLIMTRQFLLLLIINIIILETSFAIDYLDDIKLKYSLLYYEPEPAPKTNNNLYYFYQKPAYSKELRDKLPGYSKDAAPDLFPSGMLPPGILNMYTHYLFSVRNVYDNKWPNDDRNTIEEELLNAHLGIIRAYWRGYIAFLEELTGTEGKWAEFEKNFSTEFSIPSFKDGVQYSDNGSSQKRLQESNKHEILPLFVTHYSLGTFFQESYDIPISLRINALLFLKKFDPEFKHINPSNSRYSYEYTISSTEKFKNLLPETFDAGLIEDQEITSTCFFTNTKIAKIFGGTNQYHDWNQEKFQKGLLILLENHKQELIQVAHSLFKTLDNFAAYKIMILKLLFNIAESQDPDLLNLTLGGHASYRNKGRITLILDDLPLLSKEILVDTARSQRKRITEMEASKIEEEQKFNAKITALKQELIEDKARYFLGSLHAKVDVNGWFRTFKINPLLSFEDNQETIKTVYKKLARDFHPDKNYDVTQAEKIEIDNKMSQINNAYSILMDETTYNNYLNLCWNNALWLATNRVTGVYGS